jgi:hypothetical protein
MALAAYILVQATKAKHNHVNKWVHIKTSNRKKTLPWSSAMQRGYKPSESRGGKAPLGTNTLKRFKANDCTNKRDGSIFFNILEKNTSTFLADTGCNNKTSYKPNT